ncbi:hypothetical protein CJJ07_001631 [Candidozyma auris]|nr:hypothetical protein CJJ07_001631 [[Candida] auris]QEL60130.1 hypothetical protein CJJ09_002224 [[Candida] auris]
MDFRLIALALFVLPVFGLRAVPVIFGSHTLVPGLREEVKYPYIQYQGPQNVTNMLKKAITECSSDAYLIINIPGLENIDMLDRKQSLWPNLVKYMHMSSTLVGMPWVEGTLDLSFLEAYITRTCSAETISLAEEDDVFAEYVDTRKRIIRVEMNPLPPPGPERDAAIRASDELIDKVLKRIPSPYYSFLITSSVTSPTHPIPEVALENSPQGFELFYSIVNDPRRDEEVERHVRLKGLSAPQWNEDKDPMALYLERRKKDQIHLFDYELWSQNERLVSTIAVMILSLFAVKTLGVAKRLFGRKKVKSS